MAFMKLLGLCLSMFIGAYGCGEMPLRCPIPQHWMKLLTTVGVGLLIGVSFIVIIPEGVHTYYGAKPLSVTSIEDMQFNATVTPIDLTHLTHKAHDHSHEKNNIGRENAHFDAEEEGDEHDHDHATTAASTSHQHEHAGHDHSSGGDEGHSHSHQECVDLGRSSSQVGLALVAGFVVMFLVDRLGGAEEGHAHAHGGDSQPPPLMNERHGGTVVTTTSHIHVQPMTTSASSSSLSSGVSSSPASSGGNCDHKRSGDQAASPSNSESPASLMLQQQQEAAKHDHHHDHDHDHDHHHEQEHLLQHPLPPPVQFDQTATIGILVHSAIDGLALGAISVSDNSSLEFVVFMAIILHKGPAAFGLTSFLLHQGRTLAEVRRHLLYFSLAAPLTSLATYVAFGYYNTLAGSNSLSASSPDGQALLGLCLLFSAGTFLFTIAVHILPEIQPTGGNSGYANGSSSGGLWDMVALISGILLPVPLGYFGHSHGH